MAKLKKYIHECQGQCPRCIENIKDGSAESIEYGTMTLKDDMIYYPAKCLDCGFEFKEWYKLEYIESSN